ncbi:MAG: complex I NDUFA9 subunit family protein [Minwuia sp.]|uniref:complex I NDUFA9 subunit family protein n=1 Tax=Minwuia sp. TaxID=2493630 RepID=UPI003A86AC11
MRGKRVVVFGGSGFIGRYLVRRLAHEGALVTVAVRDPEGAQFLKPMGDVGQITPLYANIRKPKTLERALQHAEAVVNLVGVLHQGNQAFAGAHALGAKNIAEKAAELGIETFVQVSAIGADAASDSLYARTKAAGEKVVMDAIPTATILRPSVVFGPEDDFLNRFGAMARLVPVLPLVGGGETRFQPVYVGDVADAIMAALSREDARGKTYELGGPRVLSFREVLEFILAETRRRALLVPLPFAAALPLGAVMQFLPNPPLTLDQVKQLGHDNVVSDGAPGLAELGISAPTPMQAIAPSYLARYRKPGSQRTADQGQS